ncbi:MAG: RHS repeat-associated core domain-containing protein [Peptostreptococcales bacterium]
MWQEEIEAIDNPFRYAGEYLDEETGNYYLRARYYDPTIQRFISEDSYKGQISNPASLNVYSYCYNNPIKYVDSSGHIPVAVYLYLSALGTAPDTHLDIMMLADSWAAFNEDKTFSNGLAVILDVAALLTPYVPSGAGNVDEGIRTVAKLTDDGGGVKSFKEIATSVDDMVKGVGKGVDNFINSNIPKQYQSQVKNAFGSDVKVTTLTQDTTVYRYYGGDSAASSYWVTPNKVSNPVSELALPPGNTAQYVDSVVLPKGTTILEGTVAPILDNQVVDINSMCQI